MQTGPQARLGSRWRWPAAVALTFFICAPLTSVVMPEAAKFRADGYPLVARFLELGGALNWFLVLLLFLPRSGSSLPEAPWLLVPRFPLGLRAVYAVAMWVILMAAGRLLHEIAG